jgi:hypothetical protein
MVGAVSAARRHPSGAFISCYDTFSHRLFHESRECHREGSFVLSDYEQRVLEELERSWADTSGGSTRGAE